MKSQAASGIGLLAGLLLLAGCGSASPTQPVEGSTPKLSASEISEMRTRLERSMVRETGGGTAQLTTALRAPLVPVLFAQELSLQQTAADSLARIGPAAVPTLLQSLSSQDPKVRSRAASALARIGPEAKDAVPALTKALNDPDEDVRRQALRALGQVGAAAEPAIPAIAQVLNQPEKREEFKLPEVEVDAAPGAAPGPSPSDR